MDGRLDCSRLIKKASLAGAFFVSAIWLCAAQAACPSPGNLPQVAVQRVVDGDTLYLEDGRRIRMIGLNSPELGKRGSDSKPWWPPAMAGWAYCLARTTGMITVARWLMSTTPRARTSRSG